MLTTGVYAFQIDSGHGDAAPTTRVPRKAKLKYERIMMGELIDNDATSQGFKTVGSDETKLAFTRFKATDGEILTLPDGEFSSPDEAKRYFDRMMTSGSLKIMKQGKKLNASGKSVGWRAEFALGPEKVESKSWTIVWTKGTSFSRSTPSSLKPRQVILMAGCWISPPTRLGTQARPES
jgi:hypothetical protein